MDLKIKTIYCEGVMFLIDKVSITVATILFNNSYKNKHISLEKLIFGLNVAINTMTTIIILRLLVTYCGLSDTIFQSIQAFGTLRVLTGGYHIKSGDLCVLVSVLMFITISFIDVNNAFFIVISILSFLLVLTYAPSNIPKQAKYFVKYSKPLKIIALSVILYDIFILKSYVVSIAFFAQSLTLISNKRGFIDE